MLYWFVCVCIAFVFVVSFFAFVCVCFVVSVSFLLFFACLPVAFFCLLYEERTEKREEIRKRKEDRRKNRGCV
ncbi:hypothetical protein BZA77DRAFT_309593 [Pyronema omphalodes]|nr:hypothetical protein BZA77DRAFT_309593 [Pyronema omphalodes]